jgi:hypothetical protein
MPDSRTARHRRDCIDRVIELASGLTAAGMFAYGVALSYQVLHAIAAPGLLPWAARLWPLGFEAFMASAALNALAEQRHRRHLLAWSQRVPWYPWTPTGLTAGASIVLNWLHPAIPLDPPPGWLVSLVYGLPPLAAVFAWHLFLQRLSHRHRQDAQPAEQDGTVPPTGGQDAGQDGESAEPRELVRSLLAGERSAQPVTGPQVQAATGLSRSRAYAVLREVRAETRRQNGQAALLGREVARSDADPRCRDPAPFQAPGIPPAPFCVRAPVVPGASLGLAEEGCRGETSHGSACQVTAVWSRGSG